MESYQTYLQKNNTLPIENSIRIYNQMISSFAQCKTEGKEDIIEQLIKSACYYTNIRSEWEFMDNEAKSKDDINRTSAHDSFIRNLNFTIPTDKPVGLIKTEKESTNPLVNSLSAIV